MRVMLLHKLPQQMREDYVLPQKLIADVGMMVSDARDAGRLRMTGGAAPNFPTASELPLLGSSRRPPEVNQDSPDPESVPPGQRFRSSCPERVTYRASVPASLP